VIERILKEGRGGLVEIFNPASNSMELYDWDCLMASVKIPYCVVVAR
jgi:hypothetical protein